MSVDSDESNLESNNECEFISFIPDSHYETSQEEIGKWVDKLMSMPETDYLEPSFLEDDDMDLKDPFMQVAERILSEGNL